jgi:hypothetical protein
LHEGCHQRVPTDNEKQVNVFFNLACRWIFTAIRNECRQSHP